MRGKYSPTVNAAYQKNQNWFNTYSGGAVYDPEGYDLYGYNIHDEDRAGNKEDSYSYSDIEVDDPYDDGINYAQDRTLEVWGFDGVKPVKIL